MWIILPFLYVIITQIDANLSLGFKVIRIPAGHTNPANCSIGNTTFAHGETFKLDCKTQCVCENGRHACSPLCPSEQLPGPEESNSCRSPRLVEVPGHCCKMWLCENPTADVYAACHNSTNSPWTHCSRSCGLGISTRQTVTAAGCSALSSKRLCENRRCEPSSHQHKPKHHAQHMSEENFIINAIESDEWHRYSTDDLIEPALPHKVHKVHECKSLLHLGPARIKIDTCVSKKLYRPKLCGHCHQHTRKCCLPSASTTIQVELLCPLNVTDPINYVERQAVRQPPERAAAAAAAVGRLWNTESLGPIDQDYMQSHRIQIENKFIAVEWISKCECSKANCRHLRNRNEHKAKDNPDGGFGHENHAGDIIGDVEPELKADGEDVQEEPDLIPYPLQDGTVSWQTNWQRGHDERQRQRRRRRQHQHHKHPGRAHKHASRT